MTEITGAVVSNYAWSVEGVEIPSGTKSHPFHDGGIVEEAETGAEAFAWLLQHGPFWGILDSGQPFTLSIRPADREAANDARLP